MIDGHDMMDMEMERYDGLYIAILEYGGCATVII
jgi:hypothetical protein